MRFEMAAIPADQFATWMETARTQGQTLDAAAYDALARPSNAVAPMTFARVAPGLFETIVAGGARADHASHEEQ